MWKSRTGPDQGEDGRNYGEQFMYLVRQGKPDDYKEIARFQQLLAFETEGMQLGEPTVTRGVQAVFEDSSKGMYYVAEQAGEIVACLLVTPEWSDWRNGTVLWIQSVYVASGHRKKGLFKKLYNHLQTIVQDNSNYKGLRLYVDRTNRPAQAVYNAIGMDGAHYQLYEWMK